MRSWWTTTTSWRARPTRWSTASRACARSWASATSSSRPRNRAWTTRRPRAPSSSWGRASSPPPRRCSGGSALGDGGAGQGVGAVVQVVAAVAGDLVPRHVVARHLSEESLPEIAVLYRLLLRVAPAVPAPALVPLVAEAVHYVGTVAVELDGAPLGEGAEALEGGHQLHAVVGGRRLADGELDLDAVVDENGRPTAGAGIAAAGAVDVDVDGHVRVTWSHRSSAWALDERETYTAPHSTLSPEGRGNKGALPIRGETIGYGSQ